MRRRISRTVSDGNDGFTPEFLGRAKQTTTQPALINNTKPYQDPKNDMNWENEPDGRPERV